MTGTDAHPPPRPVREEEALLDHVRRFLLEHPEGPGATDRVAVEEMAWLREQVANAKEEDLSAIFQQYEQLSHRVRQHRERLAAPPVDPECPYFAHLRIRDQRGERDLLLGRTTRLEEDIRIVDWRNAPISGIFYRYQEGEEFEEQVGDVVLSGEVLARRTVGISGGLLYRVDTPDAAYVREPSGWTRLEAARPRLLGGEGSAFRAHEGPAVGARLGAGGTLRADKRLPEITALIDPHQFGLITRPASGLVVVRGGAGSGKTTVALHRIAYLAWADHRRFTPSAMLVLVWGRALKNYVSHVLPSLGVEGVQVRTWEDWAHELRVRHFPRLPRGYRPDTPAARSRLKLHPALPPLLARRIRARAAPATGIEALDDFVSLLADGERVAEEVAREHATDFPPGALAQAARQCVEQASQVRTWIEGGRDEPLFLDPEDDALLLRCFQHRAGHLRTAGQRGLRYAHVVVDEVQDFSAMELGVVLDCLDEGKSATLAGDTAQHIVEGTGFQSWEDFFRQAALEGTVVETLQVSYRSTRHVALFARSLLGEAPGEDPPPRATRDGPPVEYLRFTDAGACVAFLADNLKDLLDREPLANVALVAPDPQVARVYHDGLSRAEVPRLRLVLDQDFSFAPGVEVTVVQDVKGLEFDYVVLLEASAAHYPDTGVARRQLHVGATRAIHQLWLTSVGTPAAAIRAWMRDAP